MFCYHGPRMRSRCVSGCNPLRQPEPAPKPCCDSCATGGACTGCGGGVTARVSAQVHAPDWMVQRLASLAIPAVGPLAQQASAAMSRFVAAPAAPSASLAPALTRDQEVRADLAFFGLTSAPPDKPICNCPQGEGCVQLCGPFGHLCKWKCSGGDEGWSWKRIRPRL